MNTWLSGMSPVAAEFASACSADGAALVVVRADCVGDLLVVVAAKGGALLVLEPQPATNNPAVSTKATTRAGIFEDGGCARLNSA